MLAIKLVCMFVFFFIVFKSVNKSKLLGLVFICFIIIGNKSLLLQKNCYTFEANQFYFFADLCPSARRLCNGIYEFIKFSFRKLSKNLS